MLASEGADGLGIEGVGVEDDAGIENQRRPERCGVAVGMEERQNPERDIGRRHMEDLTDRADVRRDVLLGEHHPLRIAGRSGGEDHGEDVIGPEAVESERPLEHGQRQAGGLRRGHELVEAGQP